MDRRRSANLDGVQALGRLSDQMVFSLGHALYGPALEDEDFECFTVAAALFELIADGVPRMPQPSHGMLFSASGFLNALHVVEQRSNGEGVEDYARQTSESLRRIVAARDVPNEDRPILEPLRELFAEVGEVTLSQAGELSLPEEAYWPPIRQAI